MMVLDLYCGMGGLSLGFALAGVRCLGLDWDSDAVKTYNWNLSGYGCEARECDVRLWSPKGDYEVVVGGPPCQPYSSANLYEKGEDHPLYPTLPRFFEVADTLQPPIFLMENIKRLATAYGSQLKEELGKLRGYRISMKVLNAADYGVPQFRERLFIVGLREDLKIGFRWPRKTHVKRRTLTGLEGYVTAGEAIGDLADSGEPGRPHPSRMRRVITLNQPSWTLRTNCDREILVQSSPARTVCSRAFLSPDGVNKTFVGKSDRILRKLTIREALRLQSFPDWWSFPPSVSKTKRYRLVGEAVPPILAYRLAREVLRALGLEPSLPGVEEWSLPYVERALYDLYQAAGKRGEDR